eukprot:COSAG01_NODE_295_length_19292_cov_726.304538_11_plen_331_part_00
MTVDHVAGGTLEQPSSPATPTLRADAPVFKFHLPAGAKEEGREPNTSEPATPSPGQLVPGHHVGTSVYIQHVGGSPTAKQQRRLLHNSFSKFGKIKSVKMARPSRGHGKSKSSAMINFAKSSSAEQAVAQANSTAGIVCAGERLSVEYSRPKGLPSPPQIKAKHPPERPADNDTDPKDTAPGYRGAECPEEKDEADLLSSAICHGSWWREEAGPAAATTEEAAAVAAAAAVGGAEQLETQPSTYWQGVGIGGPFGNILRQQQQKQQQAYGNCDNGGAAVTMAGQLSTPPHGMGALRSVAAASLSPQRQQQCGGGGLFGSAAGDWAMVSPS